MRKMVAAARAAKVKPRAPGPAPPGGFSNRATVY